MAIPLHQYSLRLCLHLGKVVLLTQSLTLAVWHQLNHHFEYHCLPNSGRWIRYGFLSILPRFRWWLADDEWAFDQALLDSPLGIQSSQIQSVVELVHRCGWFASRVKVLILA